MKKLCKVLVSLALVSTFCTLNVQTIKAEEQIIKNDQTGIPDPVVYQTILKTADEVQGNKDGKLSVSEALKVDFLAIGVPGVTSISLQGINQLTNLDTISIWQDNTTNKYTINGLEDLKKLTKMTSITISDASNIKSINDIVGQNNAIEWLSIRDCNIQSLSGIEYIQNLKYLNVPLNTTNTATIDANQLLPFTNSLVNLDLSGWKINNADTLGNLKSLITLSLADTTLTKYDFIKNLSLHSLSLSNTGISDISFLKNQTKMYYLYLGQNNISDISVLSTLPNLKSLNADNNKISDISVLKNSKIEIIELTYNKITNIEVIKSMPNLYRLYLTNNNISDISSLTGMTFKGYELIDLSDNQIVDISALKGAQMSGLLLSSNQITDLSPLTGCVMLERLSVSNNKLSTLPDLTKLIHLRVEFTRFGGNALTAEELKAKMPKHLANDAQWIQRNKMDEQDDQPSITIPDIEEIIHESIPEDLADILETKEASTIKVILPSADTVNADVFKAVKENTKTIQFDVTDKSGVIQYGWKFNGSDIKNPDMNIDLTIHFETEKQKEIEALTNQSNMFYVSFTHHGKLPGQATIKVKVDDKFKNGELVYLYYYNEEKGTIEQNGKGFIVKDGYVEFIIDHCSVYYLSTEEYKATKPEDKNSTTPNTGDYTNTITNLIGGFGAIALVTILKTRKENELEHRC